MAALLLAKERKWEPIRSSAAGSVDERQKAKVFDRIGAAQPICGQETAWKTAKAAQNGYTGGNGDAYQRSTGADEAAVLWSHSYKSLFEYP